MHVCVCVCVCRLDGESLLGDELSVQPQPVQALACEAHQFSHAARVEDERTHHLVQLHEELWENDHRERERDTEFVEFKTALAPSVGSQSVSLD